MSDQTNGSGRNWWEDQEQMARFEERMSASPLSRRAVLGLISAVAAGAAAAACGSDEKKDDKAKATTAPSGGSSPAAGGSTGTSGEKLAKEQTLRSTVTQDPATFDYNFNLYGAASNYVSAGLLKYDANNNPVPDLAESFTVSPDGLKYTFKMRQGSKWSNGDPITAKDFEFSWKRRLNPATGANYAAFLFDIKNGEKLSKKQITDENEVGVKAVDNNTLEVTLESAAGYFPALVAYLAAVPVHPATAQKNLDKTGTDVDKWVSSGPFKLTKWEHNKSFEITKNENYWGAKDIKLEKISYLIVKQDQRVSTYENNEIDYVPSANFGDYKRLSGDAKLSKDIFKFDQVGSWYLMPNPKFEPFNEVKVRQAIGHAIDRDKLVKDVLQGLGAPAYTQMNPGLPQYNSNKYDQYTKYEGKDAVKYLAGTKYEGGKNWPKITMSMRNNEADAHKSSQAAIAQMLKDNLGMSIDLEQGDPQAIYKEMWNGNKQLMWLRWYMDYPDANNAHFECFYSQIPAGSRRSWWENAEFAKLVVQAKGETNQEKRKQLYAQADEILVREAGAIFLYYPQGYGLLRSKIKGMPKNKEGNLVPDWNIFIRMWDSMYVVEG